MKAVTSPPRGDRTSPLEWLVAGVSALLVLAAVGFLLRDALGPPQSPPRIRVEVDSVVPGGSGYLVELSVHNRGGTTAAALVIEGALRGDGGEVETSEVTIDYVPARGTRRGGLFFTGDPRAGRLRLRPMGYARP